MREVGMNQGRPVGIGGKVEMAVLDYELWRRSADRNGDGTIDRREAMENAVEAVRLLDSLASESRKMATTVIHVGACFASPDGMFGHRPVRNWKEAQARYPDNVIAFPVGREIAAGD